MIGHNLRLSAAIRLGNCRLASASQSTDFLGSGSDGGTNDSRVIGSVSQGGQDVGDIRPGIVPRTL
jgi:hypothetical protein